MIIGTFIAQLRANAPIFGGRVAGAAEFEAGLKNYNTSMMLPSAYVRPLEEEAEPNQIWNGLVQMVHKSIGVVVEVDAQTDRRGQAPIMDLDEVQAQIFASVLNLVVGDCNMVRGTAYSGAAYPRARSRPAVLRIHLRSRLADHRCGRRAAQLAAARASRG